MPITHTDQGFVRIKSAGNVPQTMEKLEQLFQAHGLTIFARIDFSGDAARNGLTMRPEQMLIFGSPKGGTPLMQQAPTAGLDLPLKALVWEDDQSATWVAYNTPDYILQRHGLPPAMSANLSGAISLLQQISE
ncbi:MAG: DUF302 domain-containing protein [Rhodanobacter sp.]|jgi:uncharacterized protein (DUF302 family)